MQSAPSLSRPSQRPSGADSPSTVGGSAGGSMASQTSGPRSSSGSARSQASRASVPDKQLSQIEKSVTHLLVATKQLLETLTQWSRQQATENEVSDVYVRLGYEFNLACRAFNAIGVDTSDLGPVPDLLRTILEDTLSQDASPQSLDRYLPRIRDIIINLLHGLKKKQARLRSKQAREDSKSTPPPRQASLGSVGDGQAGPSSQGPEDPMPQSPQKRPSSARRYGSSGSLEDQVAPSIPRDRTGGSFSDREASKRDAQRSLTSQNSVSSMSTPALQNSSAQSSVLEVERAAVLGYPAPPPPPAPKQDDALGALQRSGELERRASRRFSAYQIQKHLGTSANGVPVLPTQTTALPNRGRDVRESLNAVRLRGSYGHGRQRSTTRQEISPNRTNQGPSTPTIPENVEGTRSNLRIAPPNDTAANEDHSSPIAKTPSDKLRSPVELDGRDISIPFPQPSQRTPLAEVFEPTKVISDDTASNTLKSPDEPAPTLSTPPHLPQFIPEHSPSPGKELTLFLQYKSKIKKYVIPEGSTGLTIGRLQLAFIEKFAWNTHQNGVDLPEIYIQDPVSGVRHELEDLNDVKDRSVLVLNIEVLDEVKRHFDDGIGSIRNLIEGVKNAMDGQETVIQRVSERQLDAAKEMARFTVAPQIAVGTGASKTSELRAPISGNSNQLAELQSLRRDIAVLRQTYSSFSSDIAASMGKIRAKASGVKTAAETVSRAPYEGDAGRARINTGKKELGEDSERLVGRVDDLQDLVEDLRKDVVSRGVRPLPRQLENVSKDLSSVTKDVKKMQEFLKREKPIWTKIWEKELQLVCEERDQLTMQEDLAADLEDDLEKAAQTFALVEQATRQQNVQNSEGAPVLRSTSRTLAIDQNVDPMKAKDGVLGEVRALQPNHESRLEAIERAEKARQKELESRRVGLFQKELGQFVGQGKLKKSGGFEETERLRRAKDDRIRKEVWERQQARAAGLEQNEKETSQTTSNEENQTPSGGSEVEEATSDPQSTAEDDNNASEERSPVVEHGESGETEESSTEHRVSSGSRKSWLPSIFTS